MIKTQPDMVFTIFVLSCFAKNSSYQQIKVIETIIQYFKVTCIPSIIYRRDEENLIIEDFSDLD